MMNPSGGLNCCWISAHSAWAWSAGKIGGWAGGRAEELGRGWAGWRAAELGAGVAQSTAAQGAGCSCRRSAGPRRWSRASPFGRRRLPRRGSPSARRGASQLLSIAAPNWPHPQPFPCPLPKPRKNKPASATPQGRLLACRPAAASAARACVDEKGADRRGAWAGRVVHSGRCMRCAF